MIKLLKQNTKNNLSILKNGDETDILNVSREIENLNIVQFSSTQVTQFKVLFFTLGLWSHDAFVWSGYIGICLK